MPVFCELVCQQPVSQFGAVFLVMTHHIRSQPVDDIFCEELLIKDENREKTRVVLPRLTKAPLPDRSLS